MAALCAPKRPRNSGILWKSSRVPLRYLHRALLDQRTIVRVYIYGFCIEQRPTSVCYRSYLVILPSNALQASINETLRNFERSIRFFLPGFILHIRDFIILSRFVYNVSPFIGSRNIIIRERERERERDRQREANAPYGKCRLIFVGIFWKIDRCRIVSLYYIILPYHHWNLVLYYSIVSWYTIEFKCNIRIIYDPMKLLRIN